MHRFVLSLALMLATLFSLPITPAQALNARSWVASNGGGSACTRAAPCATFDAALSATNAGGEINCVDQADFANGSSVLVISHSITIDCEDVQGHFGFTGVGAAAIAVEATSTDVVVLRGLDINGNGVAGIGITVAGAAALHVEKCLVRNFAASGSGWGIFAFPQNNPIMEVFVSDTVLQNNGAASSGGGFIVEPNNANGITRVVLNHVEARNNFFGIKADGTNSSGGVINMTVRDSVSSGNRSNGIVATGNSNGPAIIMTVVHTTSSQNATAGFGVISDGPKSTITLSNSTVMGNINGIGASNGGSLVSYQNNNVTLNGADGSPTSVISAK
jgi:hypothetical protein